MEFKLTDKQVEELDVWKEAIKNVYGEYGKFEYRFRPTGIGDSITVWSDLAQVEKDLTDVNNW